MTSQQHPIMVRIMHPENASQSISVPKIGPHGHSQEVRFNAQGVAVVPVDLAHVVDGALPILKMLGWRHELLTNGAADPTAASASSRPATAADMQEEIENLLSEISLRDARGAKLAEENDKLRSDLAYAEGKLGELADLDRTKSGQNLRQQLNQMATEREELHRSIDTQAQVIRQAAEALGWDAESKQDPPAYLNGHAAQLVKLITDKAVEAERLRGEKLLAEAAAKAKAAPVVAQAPASNGKK